MAESDDPLHQPYEEEPLDEEQRAKLVAEAVAWREVRNELRDACRPLQQAAMQHWLEWEEWMESGTPAEVEAEQAHTPSEVAKSRPSGRYVDRGATTRAPRRERGSPQTRGRIPQDARQQGRSVAIGFVVLVVASAAIGWGRLTESGRLFFFGEVLVRSTLPPQPSLKILPPGTRVIRFEFQSPDLTDIDLARVDAALVPSDWHGEKLDRPPIALPLHMQGEDTVFVRIASEHLYPNCQIVGESPAVDHMFPELKDAPKCIYLFEFVTRNHQPHVISRSSSFPMVVSNIVGPVELTRIGFFGHGDMGRGGWPKLAGGNPSPTVVTTPPPSATPSFTAGLEPISTLNATATALAPSVPKRPQGDERAAQQVSTVTVGLPTKLDDGDYPFGGPTCVKIPSRTDLIAWKLELPPHPAGTVEVKLTPVERFKTSISMTATELGPTDTPIAPKFTAQDSVSATDRWFSFDVDAGDLTGGKYEFFLTFSKLKIESFPARVHGGGFFNFKVARNFRDTEICFVGGDYTVRLE